MIWFQSWDSILRVVVTAVAAYAALVLFLRISGKRTLAKMNAFDLVVTVALGSTLATVILSKDTPLAEGLLALAMLVTLQYVVAWLGVRSHRFRDAVRNEPALLFYEGNFLDAALRRERVTRDEVLAAARGRGLQGLGDLRAVVLETDGSLSIVRGGDDDDSALASIPTPGAG